MAVLTQSVRVCMGSGRSALPGICRTFHSSSKTSALETFVIKKTTTTRLFPSPRLTQGCHQARLIKPFSFGVWTCNFSNVSKLKVTAFAGQKWYSTQQTASADSGRTILEEQTAGKPKLAPAGGPKAKRVGRVKIKAKPESHMPLNVVGYAVGKEIDLQQLQTEIRKDGLYTIVPLPEDVTGTLLAEACFQVNGYSREMFIFQDGAVVCWNMLESEQFEVLKFLQNLTIQPNDLDLILDENEGMYAVMNEKTVLIGDTMHLNDSLGKEEAILEKFAFSNAIAQSAKLSMWENELDKFIESLEPMTENLKDGKKTKESGKDVLRKLGEMFTLRHEINLESDLLGVPEVYWERETLETLYRQMRVYLNINKRTKVMNDKLDYCKEVLSLINGQLSDQHHVRLEWYIIILILVEVIFEVVRTIPWTKGGAE